MQWNTKGSDGRTWDTTGNYFLVHRPDRYVDVYQRVPGEGDIKLNTARQTITKGKALAQHFKDTTILESVSVNEVSVTPIVEETQEVWCGSPDDPIRGNRSMADDYHTAPLAPVPVMPAVESRTKPVEKIKPKKEKKDPVMGEGARKLDEIEARRKSAKAIQKVAEEEEDSFDLPDDKIEWVVDPKGTKELGMRTATYWSTACNRYGVVRMVSSVGAAEYTAIRYELDGSLQKHQPLELEAGSKNHVKYYPTMRRAVEKVREYHCQVTGRTDVTWNADELLAVHGNATGAVDQSTKTLKAKKNPQETSTASEATTGNAGRGVRYELFAHPVTAVLRALGKKGWKFPEAKKALVALGVECAEATMRIQLSSGAKGARGEPANLTTAQWKELEDARG